MDRRDELPSLFLFTSGLNEINCAGKIPSACSVRLFPRAGYYMKVVGTNFLKEKALLPFGERRGIL